MAHPSREIVDIAEDYASCREIIRTGSRSFHLASLLLPPSVRTDACALYAFCRMSDDAVDGPDAEADALERLRERLDLVYRRRPKTHCADRAFAAVVERVKLPRALPEALLDGFAWDVEGRPIRTTSDLFAYSARVAAAVGAMMTVIMGVRDHDVLARACDLGLAMQLTNIARDVGEDARNGRIYLPEDWCREAGLDVGAFLAAPRFDDRVGALTKRVLDEADALYRRSEGGIAGLPYACRPAIHAARLVYREIGEEVRRRGYDSVSGRAVVGGARKNQLLRGAFVAALTTQRGRREPPLAETRFLVEAVPEAGPARLSVDQKIGRMVELMGEIDRRKRSLPQAPGAGL